MSRLQSAVLTSALLSVLSFPCPAETPEEQFSRMDLDKDGFLSEREFVQGMSPSASKTGNPFTKEARPMETLSAAEKRELINDTVREAKKMLPFRVDQATTWTDVYGRDENIHYVYRIDMDISAVPAEQAGMMRSMLEGQICPKVKPAMCGVTKDT